MAEKPMQPMPAIDPDSVEEVLCDGPFFMHPHGNLATLAFTHSRPLAGELFKGTLNLQPVVRARITKSLENFAALRDLLAANIKNALPGAVDASVAEIKH